MRGGAPTRLRCLATAAIAFLAASSGLHAEAGRPSFVLGSGVNLNRPFLDVHKVMADGYTHVEYNDKPERRCVFYALIGPWGLTSEDMTESADPVILKALNLRPH